MQMALAGAGTSSNYWFRIGNKGNRQQESKFPHGAGCDHLSEVMTEL
jgi:hypothetical protein